jgi:hypothetical protein
MPEERKFSSHIIIIIPGRSSSIFHIEQNGNTNVGCVQAEDFLSYLEGIPIIIIIVVNAIIIIIKECSLS